MEMGATPDEKVREASDRLILLLITKPLEGWEAEFEDITRREIQRLAVPVASARGGSKKLATR